MIDKPAGILSQEDATGKPDVLSIGKEYLKKKYNKPGNVYLGLVHRLDQPVSGVMVLARTSKAASRLSEQIRIKALQKTYWAIVEGVSPQEGSLVHYLEKDTRTNTVKAYDSKRGKAKLAELRFSTYKQSRNYSLVIIELKTGRPHQIRVQFAKIGHPIWGDYKYGEKDSGPGKALALRSTRLGLIHPTTKKELIFEAQPPLNQQPWNLFDF